MLFVWQTHTHTHTHTQAILQAIEKQRREGGEPPAAGMDIDSSSSSPSSSSSSGRGGRWSSRGGDDVSATPSSSSEWAVEKPASGSRKRSRWDQTPVGASGAAMQTPMGDAGLQTPMTGAMMTPREMTARRYQHEIDVRNQPWTNEQLDELLPGDDEGFAILDPPEDYQPPARKIQATPTPMRGSDALFTMPEDGLMTFEKVVTVDGGVEFTKPEDHEVFGQLLEEVDEDELTEDEKKERTMMKWLIRIKNGTPAQRKSSMRRVTENARWIGPDLLFRKGILPVLMSESLEELERHYFVKVIDRVLYKLDDLVRPYVSSILTVIQPMLIDGDFHARVEGREIISSLAKAAGLGHMIATMRPDLDHADEYVRNTTARAFAVVASALGVHSMLKFLGAVTTSKKSWQARHTGIRIVQHIATLLGVGVLPHLTQMVSVIKHGLEDEHAKVRCVTGLALAALAEASHPYGIESFGPIVRPLWKVRRFVCVHICTRMYMYAFILVCL
jgi:splicing factor 3B subunit 1